MKKSELKTLLFVALFLLLSALIFIQFLKFHEARVGRVGIRFEDPFFSFLPAFDVSFAIFSITYGSLILYFGLNYKKEHFISKLMLAYALIILMRIGTMSTLPLLEPESLVFLNDPFLNNLIYPGKVVRDLFFSGHTALAFAIFLLSGKKYIFLVLTVVLAVLLMIQRVHYSIDVLAAIPFAWLAVTLADYSLLHWSFKRK